MKQYEAQINALVHAQGNAGEAMVNQPLYAYIEKQFHDEYMSQFYTFDGQIDYWRMERYFDTTQPDYPHRFLLHYELDQLVSIGEEVAKGERPSTDLPDANYWEKLRKRENDLNNLSGTSSLFFIGNFVMIKYY